MLLNKFLLIAFAIVDSSPQALDADSDSDPAKWRGFFFMLCPSAYIDAPFSVNH